MRRGLRVDSFNPLVLRNKQGIKTAAISDIFPSDLPAKTSSLLPSTSIMAFDQTTTAAQVVEVYKDTIQGKNVVITGVSPKTFGAEYVAALAPHTKTIIVASRSAERAEESIAATRKAHPRADIRIVEVDLTSGKSIRAAAAKINGFQLPIHVLLNNAVMIMPETLTHTEDGFEHQIGGNYFGHFLFTSLLFPAILASRVTDDTTQSPEWTPRIVNLTSGSAFWGGEIRWDDMHFKNKPEEYNRYLGYNQSKTGTALFTVGLVKRYPEILAFSVHPGLARETNIGRATPTSRLIEMGILNEDGTSNFFLKTIEQGAATALFAAFDPSVVTHNGDLLSDCAPASTSLPIPIPEFFNSPAEADKLWDAAEAAWDVKFAKVESA
ncbi:NAD(P)-binding protein [Clavulina sp. PMI_390]|nr:NAD(P)-binding protein [Clavulina sp. PMI_390]